MPNLLYGELADIGEGTQEVDHVTVEVAQQMVAELLVVHQIPLAARIFIAPSVAFARKVYPFGMAEFVAHEVEVAAIDG